jgi:hypothetical protein
MVDIDNNVTHYLEVDDVSEYVNINCAHCNLTLSGKMVAAAILNSGN